MLGCTTAHLDAALRLQGCGLGLLGHSTGLAGTWYWDCWDVALGLMGCSPGIAGTWHWVYQDVVLGLLGPGTGIAGTWGWDLVGCVVQDSLGYSTGIAGIPYWDCWDSALGLRGPGTGTAEIQHWDHWGTSGIPKPLSQRSRGLFGSCIPTFFHETTGKSQESGVFEPLQGCWSPCIR